MAADAKRDTLSIKKVLRCSIRISYRCASEHCALFSLVLLLYLLYRSSPGLFAFIISSSPVIICATLLLGILLSYGSTHLPESVEDRKTDADFSAPKFGCFPRNIHFEAHQGFSVPAVKENTAGFKCWEIRNPSFGKARDEIVPLLKGSVDQGDERVYAHDRLAEVFTSVPSVVTLQQEVGLEEFMKTKHERESKDPFCSNGNSTEYASLFEDAEQKRVDEKEATFGLCSSSENDWENGETVAKENQGKEFTDAQSDNVGEVSEDKPAKKASGTCKWGHAFSVRQRKKLDGIKIEAINVDFSSQLDSSLVSPCARVGDHDVSSGFDSGKPENSSSDITLVDVAPMPDDIDPPLGNDDSFKLESSSCDITMDDVAPMLDEIDPPLGNEFQSPDPIGNDDSGCGSSSCQDSQMDSGNNNKPDTSKAENDAKDGEKKKDNGGNQPEFLGTADEDKDAMDLGYSEVERSRRLEFLMAKRRSRKNIIFDLDGNDACQSADRFSRFRMQVQPISVSRRSPFDLASDPDEAAIPGSAPSIMHRRNNLFESPSVQSDDSSVSAHDNLDSQESMTGSRRDMVFKRHDTFNFGGQERQRSRFKPCFVLDPLDIQEESTGSFQRQFSDKSVSKLSVVSECDTLSSVADQEECNGLVKKDFQRWFSDKSLSRLSAVSESDTLSSVADQEERNDLAKKDLQRWFSDKSLSRLSVVSELDTLPLVADQEEHSDLMNKDFRWYFQRQFSDKSVSKVTVVSESDTLSLVADQEEHADFNKDFLRYFQRQFSDKSMSRQSVVTESDNMSSVADQEDRNDIVKRDFLLGDASPELLRQGSDVGNAGSECPDTVNFAGDETLNASVTSGMESLNPLIK